MWISPDEGARIFFLKKEKPRQISHGHKPNIFSSYTDYKTQTEVFIRYTVTFSIVITLIIMITSLSFRFLVHSEIIRIAL